MIDFSGVENLSDAQSKKWINLIALKEGAENGWAVFEPTVQFYRW